MPPKTKAKKVRRSKYLIVNGNCHWTVTRLSDVNERVRIDIDAELLSENAPIERTGPIEGATFGQNQQAGSAVIKWRKPSPGVIIFEGAPTFRVTATVIFPAEETT